MPAGWRAWLLHLRNKLHEEDKQQHIEWSFWLTHAACLLWPLPWALAAVTATGLCKEIWDARYGSGFCWYDMLGNAIGITLALMMICLAPEGLYYP